MNPLEQPLEPDTPPGPPPGPLRPPPSPATDEDVVTWLEESPQPDNAIRGEPAHSNRDAFSAGQGPLLRRRRKLPLVLFGLTCLSTFLAGVSQWNPWLLFVSTLTEGLMPLRRAFIANWLEGVEYTTAVLAVLLAHEMGHFIATLIHRIPASYPFFLPFPVSPLGTLGAVIGMDGSRADRKEIFDIGLAGPIAGLVVAVPLFVLGLRQVNLNEFQFGAFQLDLPFAATWLMQLAGTPGYAPGKTLWQAQLNPMLMSGWVGFFVTGLNMLPVSQLDGGHVIYTLFGRKSHWIARTFIIAAIAYMILSSNLGLIVMIGLILFIGTDHPPTRDDAVPLGWFRIAVGCLSLAIPLLCFPPRVIIQ